MLIRTQPSIDCALIIFVSIEEAQSLISELSPEERNVQGRTRGNKIDAYASERAVDAAVDAATEMDPGQKY